MSSKNISLEEYRKSLKNKKKMFDITFPTPEILNKYRVDDENINKKNLQHEEINKKMKIYLNYLIKILMNILMKKN